MWLCCSIIRIRLARSSVQFSVFSFQTIAVVRGGDRFAGAGAEARRRCAGCGGEHRMSHRFEISGERLDVSPPWECRDMTRRADAQPLANVAIVAPLDEPGQATP